MFSKQGKRFTRMVSILAALGLSLGLAACGADEDAGAKGEDGLVKVRLANFGMIPSAAYVAWAVEGGYFEKHGIDLELNPPFLNSAEQVNSLINGDADLSLASATTVASVRNVGQPIVVVANLIEGFPLELALTPENDAKWRSQGLTETSPIKDRLAALKGMTIGTNTAGSSLEVTFRYLLIENGFDPDEYLTLQPMPDLPSQVAALTNKKVDGLMSSTGGSTSAVGAQGTGVIWSLLEGSETLEVLPHHNIVATEAKIKSDPEMIESFLKALTEARDDFAAGLSGEDAAKVKAVVAPDMDQRAYDQIVGGFQKVLVGPLVTTEEAWDATLDVAQLTSDTPVKVSFEDAVDNSFADKVTG